MLVTKVIRGVLCLVVLLSISAISAGPAEGEGVMTEEDTPVSITLIGNDPDGDALTYNVATGPSHGRLSGTAPKLTYTPEPNFNGTDSFTFVINDGTVDSLNTATVSINVTPTGSQVWLSNDLETGVWKVQGNPRGKDANKVYSYNLPGTVTNIQEVKVTVHVSSYSSAGSDAKDGIPPCLEAYTGQGHQIGAAATPSGPGIYSFDQAL